MDSDVAPERGLSSSMGLYSHEGEGEGGGGRASAPGVSRTEPAGLGMPWPGRRQAQEAPKTVPGTLRSCTTRFQTENAWANFTFSDDHGCRHRRHRRRRRRRYCRRCCRQCCHRRRRCLRCRQRRHRYVHTCILRTLPAVALRPKSVPRRLKSP